jgi:hypothetical protein
MRTPMSLAVRLPGAIDQFLGTAVRARPAGPTRRDVRLDFFRGLSLLIIFIDHIPDNFLSNVTLHSVAFCDAAEVFVFISGFAAALAYGRLLASDGFPIATMRIYHRVWQLYVAHIFVFAVFAAVVSYSIVTVDDPAYTEAFNFSEFLSDPPTAFAQVMTLRFQPQFLNILPMYIVILAGFPLALAAIARHPLLALVPSGALYALVLLTGWQMPAYPEGATWFFNPLAWQFLFVIGAVAGYSTIGGTQWLPQSRWFSKAAFAVVAVVALISFGWMVESNITDQADALFTALAPHVGNKANLDPIRLVSFAALAITAARLLRADSRLLSTRPARWLIACGQNSLHIFCFGILLAVLGQFALTNWDGGWLMQALVDFVGCGSMIGLALLLAWYRRSETRVERTPGMANAVAASR